MWYNGLLDLTWWQVILATLILTHITIVSVTLYLHRHSAHNALDLHPALAHFFRFWLWLATGTVTKEWTSIHRKHHAKCEQDDDPHSPVVKGINTVLWTGYELYQKESLNQETLDRYGRRTPDDWIERNLYTRHRSLGVAIMGVIDLLCFGVIGITVWAVQMIWIPFFAAGVINGIGHFWGYRNFECSDNARNISPFGILIGGEELHNNHHTYPNSAKLSMNKWEVDIGWMWICFFNFFGLAKARNKGPIAHRVPGKQVLDGDTVLAIANNRFQIMAQYQRTVMMPALKQQKAEMAADLRPVYKKARKLLVRDASIIKPSEESRINEMLQNNSTIRLIYEKHQELQAIWRRSPGSKVQEKLNDLMEWCKQAEASGIKSLEEFAALLKSYSLQPAHA